MTEPPEGLLDAFWAYEHALAENDVEALDRLFESGPGTLRGDAGGLLVGHDAISRFRRGRGGAPQREILAVEVRPVSADAALVVAVTAPRGGGRGQQTQLWRRGDSGWVVEVAHVSVPAPAIASATWRVVGSPLLAGAASGPLSGESVAVKDLFEVEGFVLGAGVPAYLAEGTPAAGSAAAVRELLDAGAVVAGIAQTDEFAYSIAGRNSHYGTPPNPAVVGATPGGSSSGPASAVASGQASIGLGSDTGGSIRVPASYTGLWGLRSIHGSVSRSGLLPLDPTFDTVGWLTRDSDTLAAAARASLDERAQEGVAARFAVAPALSTHVSAEVREVFHAALEGLALAGLADDLTVIELGDIDALFEAFRMLQATEVWQSHGGWVAAHPGALAEDVAARFAFAAAITEEGARAAVEAYRAARIALDEALGDRVLLLPSASSIAPSITAPLAEIEAIRAGTLRLTSIAGITSRPAVSVPVMAVPLEWSLTSAPVGLCLVGPRYTDLALIELGERIASVLKPA